MTVLELAKEAEKLSFHERKELLKIILDSLENPESSQEEYSILELAGLGREVWEGIDAQEYVNQLRDEWDER